MALTVTFEQVLKPYFTPCYRAHMIKMGPRFDLWDYDQVKANWQAIRESVDPASPLMPRAGCPEGVWDDHTRAQFVKDFEAWSAGGFPR